MIIIIIVIITVVVVVIVVNIIISQVSTFSSSSFSIIIIIIIIIVIIVVAIVIVPLSPLVIYIYIYDFKTLPKLSLPPWCVFISASTANAAAAVDVVICHLKSWNTTLHLLRQRRHLGTMEEQGRVHPHTSRPLQES